MSKGPTEETVKKLRVASARVEKGETIRHACEFAGLPFGAYYRWQKTLGLVEQKGGKSEKKKPVEHVVMQVKEGLSDKERLLAMAEDMIAILKRLI